jgi:hypothetical protein
MRSKRLFVKIWRDTLYRSAIYLLVGPAEKAMHWLETNGEVPLDILEDLDWDVGGLTHEGEVNGNYAIIIWMPSFNMKNNEDMVTLAHECFHATEMILKSAGVTFIRGINEPYAYYLGWVFGECLKRLRG